MLVLLFAIFDIHNTICVSASNALRSLLVGYCQALGAERQTCGAAPRAEAASRRAVLLSWAAFLLMGDPD
jgi:hypothetical protein